jgi:hypothetical protein
VNSQASKGRLTAKRSRALKVFLEELEWPPARRYAELLGERGSLLAIGAVDVDVEQLIYRPFLCDCQRCISWSGSGATARALVDRSCCSRYTVPVTGVDRKRVLEVLDRVRERLPEDHRLQDPNESPFELDGEFQYSMVETDQKVCQFVLYEEGRSHCAIHKTCLEEGLPVAEYKPLSCSLWPIAFVDYADEQGNDRYLLTVYGKETAGLFDQEEEGDFACLVDQNSEYEPMYRSVQDVLTHLLGSEWYAELDRQARVLLG